MPGQTRSGCTLTTIGSSFFLSSRRQIWCQAPSSFMLQAKLLKQCFLRVPIEITYLNSHLTRYPWILYILRLYHNDFLPLSLQSSSHFPLPLICFVTVHYPRRNDQPISTPSSKARDTINQLLTDHQPGNFPHCTWEIHQMGKSSPQRMQMNT